LRPFDSHAEGQQSSEHQQQPARQDFGKPGAQYDIGQKVHDLIVMRNVHHLWRAGHQAGIQQYRAAKETQCKPEAQQTQVLAHRRSSSPCLRVSTTVTSSGMSMSKSSASRLGLTLISENRICVVCPSLSARTITAGMPSCTPS